MDELRKVTMNFYAEDIAYFERHYGPGWSGYIRELVHNAVRNMKYDQEDLIDA